VTATIIDVAVATTIAEILQRASELSDSGAHGHALAQLDGALETYPGDAEVHTARGWALENLEPARLVDARAAYEAAVAIDAGQLWARVGLATVLGRLGLSHLCPPIYRDVIGQAAARAPREPELIELLGWCQYRLGQLDEAADTFRGALGIDDAWVAVHFDLGLVLHLLGDAAGAGIHYRLGLRALAERAASLQAGPLKVALDDLDDALLRHPSVAAEAAPLREQLARALQAASNGHG